MFLFDCKYKDFFKKMQHPTLFFSPLYTKKENENDYFCTKMMSL